MDSNINTGTISLLSLNPFNVYNKFLSVYLHNFPNLLALIMTSYNLGKEKKKKLISTLSHIHILFIDFQKVFVISAIISPGCKLNNEGSTSTWRTQATPATSLSNTCFICEWFSSSFHFHVIYYRKKYTPDSLCIHKYPPTKQIICLQKLKTKVVTIN